MIEVDYIAQPSSRTTLDAVATILSNDDLEQLDVAAAYVTSGGVRDLLGRVHVGGGANWNTLEKRWITSFDYCRTEPVALDALLSTPSSIVRVFDADFCLANRGTPRVPFHPKAFIARSAQKDFVLAGSGNLSRSGLSRGFEAGMVIEVPRNAVLTASPAIAVAAMRSWFSSNWDAAIPVNAAMLAKYSKLFEDAANLKAPTPTEDDIASDDSSKGALSNAALLKLRACRNFWIEAGNITKNRGPALPGNQLMMKRLSRVFFGFTPTAVPKNTLIGAVDIRYNGGAAQPYSLSYSDNKMDKLNLPMPGTDGPAEYDNKNLLFYRTAPGVVEMSLGSASEKAAWVKRSEAIGGGFKMSSGREWGVF